MVILVPRIIVCEILLKMTIGKGVNGFGESSQQGTLRVMQQDIHHYLEGSDEKFRGLQSQLEALMKGMSGWMKSNTVKEEESYEEESELVDELGDNYQLKGVFRNPGHADWERQKNQQRKVSKDRDVVSPEIHKDYQSLKHLRLSFPVLKEGGDAMEWLRDCEEYFNIYEVPDKMKASIAAMHLTGTPRSWYKSFMVGQDKATWQQFTEAFMARFGEADTELVFDKFKRLQQTSSVETYYDEFEKCRGQMLKKIPSLTKEYFLENFIGGLQGELKGMIRLLEPKTLEQALKLARYYEVTLASQPKKGTSGTYRTVSYSSTVTKGAPSLGGGHETKTSLLTTGKATEVISSKPTPLTYAQREERRKKGLCFYCDEKFVKGHECKKPQNFLMIAEPDEEEDYAEPPKFDEAPEGEEDWTGEDLVLAALQLERIPKTTPLQFKGDLQGQTIKVLIDGGSSLNLISKKVSHALQLPMVTSSQAIIISLPNGSQLVSQQKCEALGWKWEGLDFKTGAWLVDLEEWDLILGVQWLSQLGEIKCNYSTNTLQFHWQEQEITLTPTSTLELQGACNQMTSVVVPLWMEQIQESYVGDEDLQQIIVATSIMKGGPQEYYMCQGLLQYKGKWVIGKNGTLRRQIFEELHNNSIGGHSGNRATYNRISEYFQWSTLRQDVGRWVRECGICQQVKGETVKSPGLLQPLNIPQEPWRDIAMDFITGLPKSKGFEVIWVVIDRFSRYGHFVALSHPISAKSLAQVFFEQIYRLHGLPSTIVSDRDSIFLSEFWQTLFKIAGTRLNMSSAYHPQSDGSTERVNQCLEQYLRSMTNHNPKNWSSWLPAAEWWYNTTYHSTLNSTPFQVVYGVKPKHLAWASRGHTNLQGLEDLLTDREQQWSLLKDLLEAAQARMKSYADANRSEREFQVGNWVYLKLQPYRQITVAVRKNLKLSAKYFGPYKVIEKVGPVAYKLALPDSSRVHPVFHVSQLKKAIGQAKVQKQLPQISEQGTFDLSPLRQLEQRTILRDNKLVHQCLIQWKGCSIDEATWEDEDLLACNFPGFKIQP